MRTNGGRGELNDLVARVHEMELEAIRNGDGFTDQGGQHAAIDDLNLVPTFPAPVDPKQKEALEAGIRTAKHDLRYATYKLGLALLAANRLSPPAKLPHGMMDKLLSLQDDTGGWITDYDAADKKIGLANVETTCFAILGIDAYRLPRQ